MLNSILYCGCGFGSVYFHGRVQWLDFVTAIMVTCLVKEGAPWLVERVLDSKKDHTKQLPIHIM